MRLAVVLAALLALAAERRPNVLLIQTDDQGPGDLRGQGNDKIDTPHLDKLAKESVRFGAFQVCPLCAPTRASLLTGRYHLRTGVSWVTGGKEVMRPEEWTIAEALKKAGYATGIFGKWHNGDVYPATPRGQGFDTFAGFLGGHLTLYFNPRLQEDGRWRPARGFITDVITDRASAFVEAKRKGPFFCYVAYNAPHSPFQLPDALYEKYKKRGLDATTASVYGLVENVDANVGRLLAALVRQKVERDTIVVFLSDNGPNGQRFNAGVRGAKGSLLEGGTRSPLFVRWPGTLKPRDVPEVTSVLDLMPTLTDLCGVTDKPPAALDGVSLRPLLEGTAKKWPARMVFLHNSGRELRPYPGAVRTDRYRLVLMPKKAELYDLKSDPAQKADLAAKQPAEVARLKKAYDAWFAEVSKGARQAPVYAVGHAEAAEAELQAVNAALTGGVKFFGQMGWSHDWVTGWTSKDDRIAWDIDVTRKGRYEVSLLYTCAKADVGAKVRVEAAGASAEVTLKEAHEPKAVIGPSRVARVVEVPDKEWKPLVAGTLTLPAGKARLVLRALTVPGQGVMDLKAVRVRYRGP